jgi:hypothetical protein
MDFIDVILVAGVVAAVVFVGLCIDFVISESEDWFGED